MFLGELLAGVLLGPPLLGIVSHSAAIEIIAEFGIFFVMFHTGMELDPMELIEHIRASLAIAVGGFLLPFIFGFIATRALGGTVYQSLFIGMALSITAIAVQAVILHSMRINRSEFGHIIIGAFLAGQFVRREIMDENIYETINDRFFGISYGFLVPIFFASISFHLHLTL